MTETPQRSFHVRAVWDAEAEVFVSESDIRGLAIETDTLEAFEAVLHDVAPELIVANHRTSGDLADLPLSQLIPAIVFERPAPLHA